MEKSSNAHLTNFAKKSKAVAAKKRYDKDTRKWLEAAATARANGALGVK